MNAPMQQPKRSGRSAGPAQKRYRHVRNALGYSSLFILFLSLATHSTARVTAKAEGYTQISTGKDHACAVTTSGGVRCWGNNAGFGLVAGGRLGDGTTTVRNVPTNVIGISNAVSVSAGFYHSCAALADRTVRCWGDNTLGVLGSGAPPSSTTPVAVSGIDSAVAVTSGGAHNCALTSSAQVKCWGANNFGQLGVGFDAATLTTPTDVALSNIIGVSAGALHTCAVRSNGEVWCWGRNKVAVGFSNETDGGQLGNGGFQNSNAPVQVVGISNATQVSAGVGHSCARLADGTVRCWGYNSVGQLGNGTTTVSSVPVTVSGISNAVNVTAAGNDYLSPDTHSCATLSTGRFTCWGGNVYGQLGDQTTVSRLFATLGVDVGDVVSVSAGTRSSCAQMRSGDVLCTGYNGNGELGDANFVTRSNPRYVSSKCNLDLDADGFLLSTTDALLLSRSIAGLNGTTLTANALSNNALRRSPIEIAAYIAQVCPITAAAQTASSCGFDLDGSGGSVAAASDSSLFYRAIKGFSGDAVTSGAIGGSATRNSWAAVRSYLEQVCGATGLSP